MRYLNPVHHAAARICSGAFYRSPVDSLYIICHDPSLETTRYKFPLNYYFHVLSQPNHRQQLLFHDNRTPTLYHKRPSCVSSFGYRVRALVRNTTLDNVNVMNAKMFQYFPGRIITFHILMFSETLTGTILPVKSSNSYLMHINQTITTTLRYIPMARNPKINWGRHLFINIQAFSFRLSNCCSIFLLNSPLFMKPCSTPDNNISLKVIP